MRSILLKVKAVDHFSAIIFIFLFVLVFIHFAGVGKKKETMAQEILGRLRALSSVQQRRAAAILGAVVADAASKFVLFSGGCFVANHLSKPHVMCIIAFYMFSSSERVTSSCTRRNQCLVPYTTSW